MRGFVAAKIAIEPTVSISTRSNDASSDLAEARLRIAEIVEGAPPVVGLENASRQPGMSSRGPEDRCTEEDARRSEDGGYVGDSISLARERSRQAVEHAIATTNSARVVTVERDLRAKPCPGVASSRCASTRRLSSDQWRAATTRRTPRSWATGPGAESCNRPDARLDPTPGRTATRSDLRRMRRTHGTRAIIAPRVRDSADSIGRRPRGQTRPAIRTHKP